ncbi:MAG: alkaline phosphatase family protein [Spirochaetales bacterium]|nr:alkaline phosphatase family protein [Spirochaetales bacterium]
MGRDRHLVVVSFDAMVYEDLDLLKGGPAFSRFFEDGSRVNRIRTVYPSLTYPAHTSMLTGCRCGKHGIVNNEPCEVGNLKSDWYWFHDPVKVSDIHDAAKKAGLVTASVFWPVTGGHKGIDHLVAEYWAQGKDDTLEKAYKRAGTSDEMFESVVRPVEKVMSSWDPLTSDDAKVQMACQTIRLYRPNLLTVHLGQIDSFRHRNGVFNDRVGEGVAQSERYMQQIFDACKEAGVYDETDFVVCSDHGQINYTRKMNLNALFVRAGFVKTGPDGEIKSWKAWAKGANFSAQVYLKDPKDEALRKKVYNMLTRCRRDGSMGIGTVLTARQAEEAYGLYGDFSFVVESDETTLFSSDWKEPLFVPCTAEKGYGKASHGHEPSVGPQPVFMGVGPSFRKGVVLPQGSIIDEAPTYAAILGLELPDAEGKAMKGLLRP